MNEQSMIGRKLLESQLQRVGVFGPNETISDHPDFDANYKVRKYYVLYALIIVITDSTIQ